MNADDVRLAAELLDAYESLGHLRKGLKEEGAGDECYMTLQVAAYEVQGEAGGVVHVVHGAIQLPMVLADPVIKHCEKLLEAALTALKVEIPKP